MLARQFTGQILSACNSLYIERPGDDTTVVTAKACMVQPCTIMIGSPADADKDFELVDKFIKLPGKKVVCGGTTSQIVSRITGRDLNVQLDYIPPDVPPVGYIRGIDLVTEGVVTMGRAFEIIKEASIQNNNFDTGKNLNKRDGASMLARILLEQCTEARFIVGKALNPAHQNPDLPYNLGIKLGLVRNIAELLRDWATI